MIEELSYKAKRNVSFSFISIWELCVDMATNIIFVIIL